MCYYFGKTKLVTTGRNRYDVETEDAGNVQNGQENPDRKLEMQTASISPPYQPSRTGQLPDPA